MTIAETIIESLNKEHANYYHDLAWKSESEEVEIDEDIDNETTTYAFEDGSKIIWSGSDVKVI